MIERNNKIRIKICCIQNYEEAKTAIEYGADAIGLVSAMPSGPGVIDDYLIKSITRKIPDNIDTFLLTSQTEAGLIISQLEYTKTTTVQLVDRVEYSVYTELRKALPNIKIVQVIHIAGDESIKTAVNIEDKVDAILLDSGSPNLKTKILGGTGKTHNWIFSKKIADSVNIPVFLAGGLNADNAKPAINFVMPYGVDVCSGIRTNGYLDRNKLISFIDAVKSY